MKTTVLCFLISFSFWMIGCSDDAAMVKGRRLSSATAYNDYIVQHQQEIIRGFMSMAEKGEGSIDSAEVIRTRLLTGVDSSISNLKALSGFKGDTTMRNAAISLFGFYQRILSSEYLELINIRRKGDEITEEDVTRSGEIAARISEEEKKYDEAFAFAQKSFARKNNMRLEVNAMQKEVDKLNAE